MPKEPVNQITGDKEDRDVPYSPRVDRSRRHRGRQQPRHVGNKIDR
jgi:hypothetical protein